jgi:hypothetical protein
MRNGDAIACPGNRSSGALVTAGGGAVVPRIRNEVAADEVAAEKVPAGLARGDAVTLRSLTAIAGIRVCPLPSLAGDS